MDKELKKNLWWSFFITVFATIYAVIYNLLPLEYPIMWCTYVALPIFFLAGGEAKQTIPKLCVCIVSGFLWGALCLWIMQLTMGAGFMVALILGVFISVILCCGLHMGFAAKTILGCCPMVFGAFAVSFSFAGGLTDIFSGVGLTAVLTMCAGVLLGGIMAVSGNWSAKLAGITNDDAEAAVAPAAEGAALGTVEE